MPCYHPMQAFYSVREDGKKNIVFSNAAAKGFEYGVKNLQEALSLPCGSCIGCRLDRSRQWAVRCMHEAKMHDSNCFVTLTFDDRYLAEMCPNGSLDKKHMQDFMKRLRKKFSDRKIRVFYCGEYGDVNNRPHYHACLFGVDFVDKKKKFRSRDNWVYTSAILSDLWPYGISSIGELTFESAAYVARYCMKKVVGANAAQHYQGRLPEFACMSLKPGLGKTWLERYGKSDCFNFDRVVARGSLSKPPRYYDKVREKEDPEGFAKAKALRVDLGKKFEEDNTSDRLKTKEYCKTVSVSKLLRKLE